MSDLLPDPADAKTDEEIIASMHEVRREWRRAPLAAVFAAPFVGRRDQDEAPLRAIPDPVMFAAHEQHRRLLALLERAMEALDQRGAKTVALECREMLREFNRPFRKGNYGERYYDPPESVKAAMEQAGKKGTWS